MKQIINNNNCQHNFKIIEDYLGEATFKRFKIFIMKCESCGSMKSEKIFLPRKIMESTTGSRKRLQLENDYLISELKKLQEDKKK